MKIILYDLLGGLLFLAVLSLTGELAAAIAVSVGVSVAMIALQLHRREQVGPFQWLTLTLVIVMGSLSLATRDPRFVMVKPSIIQGALAIAMLRRDWLARYMSAERLARIPPRALTVAGYVYAAGVAMMALANLAVAATTGPQAWAAYNAVAPMAGFSILGLGTYVGLRTVVRARRRSEAEAVRT